MTISVMEQRASGQDGGSMSARTGRIGQENRFSDLKAPWTSVFDDARIIQPDAAVLKRIAQMLEKRRRPSPNPGAPFALTVESNILAGIQRVKDALDLHHKAQGHATPGCTMIQAKTLADALTGGRSLLALYLMYLGLRSGAAALTTACVTLLVAWIADLLDGRLARCDPRGLRTWIGNHDLGADLLVALGTWVYLASAGFIPFWLATAYVATGAVALWHFNSEPLAWGLQGLPYGAMVWIACRIVPAYGLMFVAYAVIVLLTTWSRLRQRKQEFLDGMRDLLRRAS